MISTTVMAQNVQIISEDDHAKFSGYLVSEPVFRSMLKDIKEKDLTKSQLQLCLERNEKIDPKIIEWSNIDMLAIGFASGFFVTGSLIYLIKK